MQRPESSGRGSTPRSNHSHKIFDPQQNLIRFSREGDYMTAERMVEHVLVTGAPHSSKSSATMRLLMEAAMSSGAGVFVHAAKFSAVRDAMHAAKRAGCKKIIYFGPGSGQCFNWADYEYRDFGDGKGRVDNLMSVFKSMVEVTMRGAGQKESEPFWQFMNDQGFTNLFFMDGQAKGSIDLSRILEMWQTLPKSFEDLNDPEGVFSLATLIEAEKNCPPEQLRSLRLAKNWLLKQMPGLSERTRSCVEAMAIGMLDIHARDLMQEAMGGKSTWTPEDLEDGAVIVCGWDVLRHGVLGKLIQVGCKKSIQRFINRRLERFQGRMDECRPIIMFADEAQFFIDSGDQEYLRTSREARGGCVWAIQSIPSAVDELGGGSVAENKARATFGMFQTKIYHYNNCDITNEQCARWIGQDMQRRPGGSVGVDPRGQVVRGDNWSEQPYYLIPPIAFQRLARGGEGEKWNVRAIVTMAGHKWKCNDEKYWAKIKLFQNVDKAKIIWRRWPWAPIWMFSDKAPSARIWLLHVPLTQIWREVRLEFEQECVASLMRTDGVKEGAWWLARMTVRVASAAFKRWWAFWVDDRETLLGGDHE